MRPKISVCMATFNGERFLREQLDSILKQLVEGDEIVISDDSSTDKTVAILKEYSQKDQRIRLYLNQNFRDPIRNFQNGLTHVTGEWIFLSDQDDVWLDGKVDAIGKELLQNDLVLHDSIMTDENLQVLHPSFFQYFGSGTGLVKNLIRSSYYGSCMAFHKRILEKALPFPKTKEIGHDLWIGLVSELIGKVKVEKTAYLLYRRHSSTFTPRGMSNSKRSLFKMIRGRLIMIYEILKLYKRLNSK